MNTPLTEEEIVRKAKRRVGRKMGFYTHLLVFVVVNAGLFAMNEFAGGNRWHVWPFAWWGLGLAIHGLVTFIGLSGDGMRQRMIDDEVQKLKARR